MKLILRAQLGISSCQLLVPPRIRHIILFYSGLILLSLKLMGVLQLTSVGAGQ